MNQKLNNIIEEGFEVIHLSPLLNFEVYGKDDERILYDPSNDIIISRYVKIGKVITKEGHLTFNSKE